MIETFFFVPADRQRFLEKIPVIKADNFILDFEDSINVSNIRIALENCNSINNISNFWARPALFRNGKLYLDLIEQLIQMGISKFILPKIENVNQLDELSKLKGIHNCTSILLIESAKAFNDLDDSLNYQNFKFHGLVLGSHDFTNDLQMKYDIEDLKFFRQMIHLKAKAHDIKSIDIASMEIRNESDFKIEVSSGFDIGYRCKMILHPIQLKWLFEMSFFSDNEVQFAKSVIEEFPNLSTEIEAVNFKGRILEKPHIKRILEIVEYVKNEKQ